MRPTFGDTRPSFGYPESAHREHIEPYRPTVGVQLGIDGSELPADDDGPGTYEETMRYLGISEDDE
jgi:hypothetical protein